MKFDLNGKDLICPDCYNKQHAKLPASVAAEKIKSAEKAKNIERNASSSDISAKVKYYCTNCNFRFARNEGLFVKTCPNCAKETVYLMTSNKIGDIMEDKFLKKRVYENSA